MPAAAVIPAPIAYIKVVAVKKLVVGFLIIRVWPCVERRGVSAHVDLNPSREAAVYPLLGESYVL